MQGIRHGVPGMGETGYGVRLHPYQPGKHHNGGSKCALTCLKENISSRDSSMSLNMPSSLLVNPPPHSERQTNNNYSQQTQTMDP